MGSGKINPGPFQEEQMLFTAKPSLKKVGEGAGYVVQAGSRVMLGGFLHCPSPCNK